MIIIIAISIIKIYFHANTIKIAKVCNYMLFGGSKRALGPFYWKISCHPHWCGWNSWQTLFTFKLSNVNI